jgi:hypothetical protein
MGGERGFARVAGAVVHFKLAEAVRFELTEELPLRQFSRLLHSTALPRFRVIYCRCLNRFATGRKAQRGLYRGVSIKQMRQCRWV